MSRVVLHPDIHNLNGTAQGKLSARTEDGATLHVARGDWYSAVTRSRFCKEVAGKLFPQPSRKPKEAAAGLKRRCARAQQQMLSAAAELDALILQTLDGLESQARAVARQPASGAMGASGPAAANTEAAGNSPRVNQDSGVDDGSAGRTDDGTIYAEAEEGIYFRQPTRDGEVLRPLTNFTARIVADVLRDDGAERQHCFEIEARQLGHPSCTFVVPAAQFMAMNWPLEHLGAAAIVFAGAGTKDHARAAVQWFSRGAVISRTVYAHTGWRELDGKLAFLHCGGAIGAQGTVRGVDVELPEAMAGFLLPPVPPAEGGELARCVRASLAFLKLASGTVTYPLLAAVYRAPLGEVDSAQHLAGGSGAFKSELAALCQQHFGAALDSRHLPASWSSTENALEQTAHAAKDVVLVVDDFAPGGTQQDVQRLHQKADRLIRAQGNRSARQRMRPDGTLRPARPPRGLVLSTGEDVPRGHSLRARMLVNEIAPDAVDVSILTLCQTDARCGLYAGAMAGYVRWLAGNKWAGLSEGQARACVRAEVEKLRQQAAGADIGRPHRRTPEVVANLVLGLKYLLEFAVWAGAIGSREADTLLASGCGAIAGAAAAQSALQAGSEPTERFLALLSAAVSSGNAHMAAGDGGVPVGAPGSWGWRRPDGLGVDSGFPAGAWQPKGERVGWVEDGIIYLEPEASYKVAQQMAPGGEGLCVSAQALRKRLADKGLIVRDTTRDTLTVRRTLEGASKSVLQFVAGALPHEALCGNHVRPEVHLD
jgi:hypothetical protein